MDNLLKTPLFELYGDYGAKVVDFAGWALPLQFEGIVPEHMAVREHAGLFDVSHMGEVEVTGDDALLFLNHLLTNDVSRIADHQIQYAIMLYENGGTVDDVLVYRFSENHFWVIVNAANRHKDVEWMKSHTDGFNVHLRDLSDEYSELALQGPASVDILKAAAGEAAEQLKFFRFIESIDINGIDCLVSRTGYTGEDGFELYVRNEHATDLWRYLIDLGKDFGLKPAGLGCRDTLRFEACLPLYGHELSPDITPLEAGLDRFVKLDKDDFIGKDALVKQVEAGIPRKLTGFEMIDRGIPRGGYDITADGNKIGTVTTGYFSPSLNKNIGLGLIDSRYAEPGKQIEIVIRNKPLKAVTCGTPFYTKKYKK